MLSDNDDMGRGRRQMLSVHFWGGVALCGHYWSAPAGCAQESLASLGSGNLSEGWNFLWAQSPSDGFGGTNSNQNFLYIYIGNNSISL